MNAESLKEYLKEDVERIEKALESAGCHSIWRARGEIRCAPPNGGNATSISVNVDTLFCKHYSEVETFRGDIIGLIQHLRKESFKDTFNFLKGIFGLSGKYVKDNKVDPLKAFKQIRKGIRRTSDIKEREVPKFGMEALEDFVLMPHINLFYEGIMPSTAELFKVGYDSVMDRIIFPHFAFDDINAVVGITGRTLRSKEEIKEFRIPKYWNYIKGYMKTWNLYGFGLSLPFIIRDGMIIIFEAEKSVLKEWTMTRNEGHSVSVGGHEISDEQLQIILQNTPADVEIVIALDKDVMTMKDDDGKDIGEQFIIDTCKRFSKYRKTSYIFDTYNILGEKDAPIDKGCKVWHHLLKFRKTVN